MLDKIMAKGDTYLPDKYADKKIKKPKYTCHYYGLSITDHGTASPPETGSIIQSSIKIGYHNLVYVNGSYWDLDEIIQNGGVQHSLKSLLAHWLNQWLGGVSLAY